jgi:sortase B
MKRKESEEALEALEDVLNSAPRRAKPNFFERNFIPLKRDGKREKRRKILFDIAILVMLVSLLVLLWFYVIDPGIAAKKGAELENAHGDTGIAMTTPDGGYIQAVPEEQKRRATWEQLKARNPEYVGWLSVPGARLEMPVVQGTDNNTYLKRDFDRQRSNYGNPFLDHRNSKDLTDVNLIIYGHNMRDGKIFHDLTNYRTKSTIYKYPIISLELENFTLQYKVVAVIETNGAPDEDNGYVFHFDTPTFKSRESFEGFVKELRQRTLFTTSKEGVDIVYGDQLITLQTCIYDYKDSFLVVIGRRLREGEDPAIPKDDVHHNTNIRYPQAWYNKYNHGVNPWKGKEHWHPND